MAARLLARQVDIAALIPAEHELQTVSYAVAHDLSASVRYMTTFSRLVLAELGGDLTQRQQLYADQLRAAGENCAAMLEQLAVYSQVQNRNLVSTQHDPGPAIPPAWLRLVAAAGAEGAEISVEPLGPVYADAELLSQAIAAILDNAIKFRRPDVAARVTVEPAHDEAFWRLRARDNGIGVDPRYREAAFSMFRKLNSPEAYPGVGAGLAICRRIARRHGGEAKFVDCVDGACVELAVPHAGRHPHRRGRTAL